MIAQKSKSLKIFVDINKKMRNCKKADILAWILAFTLKKN
jgi:hypothetical protein